MKYMEASDSPPADPPCPWDLMILLWTALRGRASEVARPPDISLGLTVKSHLCCERSNRFRLCDLSPVHLVWG